MCPKINVMEKECKNLKFGVHLNGALVGSRFCDASISTGGRAIRVASAAK
jgi:hypothetical protein